MKILILTQYFPPETGAPQNRLYELATRLVKLGASVEVLTAMPNYPQMEVYEGYRNKWYLSEERGGLKVHRSYIFVSKGRAIVPRLLNYFSFVISSLFYGLLNVRKSDFILCESPPLFLGISAYILSRAKGSKMIFNVSDLWPESAEKLGMIKNKFLLNLAAILEEFLYRNSCFITGQTQGIAENISKRFPRKKVYWIPNGADVSFYDPEKYHDGWKTDNGFSPADVLFLYAGIIGHAQGLEVMLDAAARLQSDERIKFVLLGEGPLKTDLMKLKDTMNLKNVFFFDGLPKEKMPYVIKAADAAIIPLKKLDLFLGAIPSKIFETLAMKKPVILGVDGEARKLFIEDGKCGLYFEPENGSELAERVVRMVADRDAMRKMGENGSEYVSRNFNRDGIADKLWNICKKHLRA